MSKIAIEGNVSGTGTLTIAAPNTNTNRTITLPDATGTLALAGGASDKIEEGDSKVEVTDTGANGTIVFNTDNAERMRIDSDGNVGIGSTSPSTFNDAGTGGRNVVIQSTGAGRGVLTFASAQTAGANELLGRINFIDSDSTNTSFRGAGILGVRGANDNSAFLRFDTANSAAGVERMRILANGDFTNMLGVFNDTTGAAANVHVNSSGSLLRSTSSGKYKTDIETIDQQYSEALLNCRPVWYRSTCKQDNHEWSWWGFVAEEVAEIDPRLVYWKTTRPIVQEDGSIQNVPIETPEAEGVQYERFVPHLLNLIKKQQQAIETLEARIAALENNNA